VTQAESELEMGRKPAAVTARPRAGERPRLELHTIHLSSTQTVNLRRCDPRRAFAVQLPQPEPASVHLVRESRLESARADVAPPEPPEADRYAVI
jgi:hypothetical protein